jgi:hypothetical protein
MTAPRPARPKIKRPGITSFQASINALIAAGASTPAARFSEALRQRRRLMKALRKLAPDHTLIIELDALDGRAPRAPKD